MKHDTRPLDQLPPLPTSLRSFSSVGSLRQRTSFLCTACGAVILILFVFLASPRRANGSQAGAGILDVQNSTLGFEKILVLNIPSRHDKRDAMALSASVSGVDFEWLEGVDGASMTAKSKPAKMKPTLEKEPSTLGCWRAHMNAMQRIVKENIQSALIMEDDADWDVNVKDQLLDFARGARFVLDSPSLGTRSPYGDDWDLLWLGHCGVKDGPRESQRMYVTRDDPTAVPSELFEFKSRMPDLRHPALQDDFSRIVFRAKAGLCANAYAVSLKGAQMLLNQETQSLLGADVADLALARLCSNTYPVGSGGKCVAPWPSLFNPYRAPGPLSKDSDRKEYGSQWRDTGLSYHVVFPTRMNLDALIGMQDQPRTIKSQWPDKTLLRGYNGSLKLPQGKGLWLDKTDYF